MRSQFALFILLSNISAFCSPLSAVAADDPNGPWRFTTSQPGGGWQAPDFDASAWTEAPGGFGDPATPGSRVNTDWNTDDIWLRRTIQVDTNLAKPALLIHYDEDVEVYLNGKLIYSAERWTTQYEIRPLTAEAAAAISKGQNTLAVHCHQRGGGQFIDAHLIDAENPPRLPPASGPAEPYKTALTTVWGQTVAPENAWREYPRPQLVRTNWTNLNGHWDYAVTSSEQHAAPTEWTGKILVPFAFESKLSGVQMHLHPGQALWYHREFTSKKPTGRRTILNFEAVDYACRVFVNDDEVGSHIGGNLPFSFDISHALRDGVNTLVVRVEDSTDAAQLRGKQHLRPHGIWYTRVSGIWQTVWLEETPEYFIHDLDYTFHLDGLNAEPPGVWVRVKARFNQSPPDASQVRYSVEGGPTVTVRTNEDHASLQFDDPKTWSPDSPHLYYMKAELLGPDGNVIDTVNSYFALRSVGHRARPGDIHKRLTLNDGEIFHFGPLDQGWWPDGLLTPPSDEALLSDIVFLKDAGFNMIRKHIKVEPRRFYYHCDRVGMMVWQDQPSCLINPPWTRLAPNPEDAKWSDADHAQYMAELDAMITHLEDVPSIVMWVPFNEAWGQHRTTEVGEWTVKRDPSRLVNVASGGNFWPVGHIADEHSYPHPAFPFDQPRFNDFVKVVGEFGGHGWPVPEHLWMQSDRNWGYGDLPKSIDEYKARYRESTRILTELKKQGIAAGVYTQTTDVEGEINGLLTYDRRVIKIPAEELREIHAPLYKP